MRGCPHPRRSVPTAGTPAGLHPRPRTGPHDHRLLQTPGRETGLLSPRRASLPAGRPHPCWAPQGRVRDAFLTQPSLRVQGRHPCRNGAHTWQLPRTSETHDVPNAAQTGPPRRGPTSEHARLADRDVQGSAFHALSGPASDTRLLNARLRDTSSTSWKRPRPHNRILIKKRERERES